MWIDTQNLVQKGQTPEYISTWELYTTIRDHPDLFTAWTNYESNDATSKKRKRSKPTGKHTSQPLHNQ